MNTSSRIVGTAWYHNYGESVDNTLGSLHVHVYSLMHGKSDRGCKFLIKFLVLQLYTVDHKYNYYYNHFSSGVYDLDNTEGRYHFT